VNRGKAILVAGHGSTTKLNEAAVERQTELLRNKGYSVYLGFKGYTKPLLKNTMVEIADNGFTDVICVPMFMTGGHYSERVIPKQVGLEEGTSSGVADIGGRKINVRITDTIGTHRLMTDILAKISESAEIRGNNRGILLFGSGSSKPDNSEMIEENARRLREMGVPAYSAFRKYNTPNPKDAVIGMRDDGIDDIVMIPMTIASSGHGDRDFALLPEFEQDDGTLIIGGERIFITYASPVGSHDSVSLILEDLIKQYL